MPHNDINLANDLSEEKLDEIAGVVSREFQIDETNFRPRKERIEELYRLALQAIEEKDYPLPNASNVKIPIITKAALGFSSMAYPAIVKDDQVVKAKVVGEDKGDNVVMGSDGQPAINQDTGKEIRKNEGLKQKRADRVGKFMSHQVLNEMDGWEDDMDKILLINPIVGCSFKKTYYDPLERMNVSRLVLPQFVYINIDARSVESASRVSELIEFYPDEIQSYIKSGAFVDFNYGLSNETQSDSYEKRDEEETSAYDPDSPHVFIEQHRRIDLDEDGYAEPCIVWLHKESNKVVRITPRYDDHDVYRDESENIIRIKAQSHYIKFGFIPDPEGSPYDIGFGHMLQHLNEAMNSSVNQMLDQGHRYTMGGGFIGDGLRMKSGNIRFRPGEYKRVKTSGMSIRENVVPLPMPEPSTVLMALVDFLIKSAEDVAAMTKIMAGDIPANMPATTAMASIEQGMQSFKAVYKRIHRSLKKEFKRLFYLNRMYLTQEEYENILDDESANVEKDFSGKEIDVIPLSDSNMLSSTQSFIRAQFLMSFMQDTLMDGVELRQRIFKDMNIKDAEDLILVPQPQQPDILVESQVAALQAQIVNMKNDHQLKLMDADRKEKELNLKIEESISKMKKTAADGVLSLARAEAEEEGVQLEKYKTDLNQLTQEETKVNGQADPGNMDDLAQPADN